MLFVYVWVVWLTFATEGGVSFGVLTLTPEECEIKAHAFVNIAAESGIEATYEPCVRVKVAVPQGDAD